MESVLLSSTVLLLQDFVYSAGITLFFFIASISFAADNSATTVERSAVVRKHRHTGTAVPLHLLSFPVSSFPSSFLSSWMMEVTCSGVVDMFILSSSRRSASWRRCCFSLTSSSFGGAGGSPLRRTGRQRRSRVTVARWWWQLHQRWRDWTRRLPQQNRPVFIDTCAFVRCAQTSHYFTHCSFKVPSGGGAYLSSSFRVIKSCFSRTLCAAINIINTEWITAQSVHQRRLSCPSKWCIQWTESFCFFLYWISLSHSDSFYQSNPVIKSSQFPTAGSESSEVCKTRQGALNRHQAKGALNASSH